MTVEIKQVNDEFSVSAQINLQDVQTLAAQGIRSLICNRPDGEAGDQINVTEIETAAAESGMEVVYLPVISGDFTDVEVSGFLTAIERLPKPTHAYCRTGTRSITLWAFYQRRLGVPNGQILAAAQRCGYDLSNALQAGDQRARGASHYDILIIGGRRRRHCRRVQSADTGQGFIHRHCRSRRKCTTTSPAGRWSGPVYSSKGTRSKPWPHLSPKVWNGLRPLLEPLSPSKTG